MRATRWRCIGGGREWRDDDERGGGGGGGGGGYARARSQLRRGQSSGFQILRDRALAATRSMTQQPGGGAVQHPPRGARHAGCRRCRQHGKVGGTGTQRHGRRGVWRRVATFAGGTGGDGGGNTQTSGGGGGAGAAAPSGNGENGGTGGGSGGTFGQGAEAAEPGIRAPRLASMRQALDMAVLGVSRRMELQEARAAPASPCPPRRSPVATARGAAAPQPGPNGQSCRR